MMSCFYARLCVCFKFVFRECGNEAKEEKLKLKSTVVPVVLVKSSSLVVEK